VEEEARAQDGTATVVEGSDGGGGLPMKDAMVSSIFSPLLSLSWAAVLHVRLFTSPVLHHSPN
jgi:hypothetical protein